MTAPQASNPPPSTGRPRVLVLHAGALGDLILSLHFLQRSGLTAASETTLASRSSWALWAAKQEFVDHAVLMDRIGFHAIHCNPAAVPPALREFLNSFDHVLSLLGGRDESVSQHLGETVGHDKLTCIDPRPSPRTLEEGTHIVDQWLQDWQAAASHPKSASLQPANSIARQLRRVPTNANASRTALRPEVPHVPTTSAFSSAKSAPSADKPLPAARWMVLLHPGSGGLAKCLPLEALEQVAAAVASRGDSIGWIIGPDENERFGEGFADRLRLTAPLVWEEHPGKAVAALRWASAYIGMDAGMTHVAALLGVPTLAVFGPTDPRVWRPLGPTVRCMRFPEEQEALSLWIEKLCAELRAVLLDTLTCPVADTRTPAARSLE
ncbi:MAG: hypothetical protein HY873_09780 [Chloroflexi bacterium]|nr:hypothetical protein [Chloroflexota bacterium]